MLTYEQYKENYKKYGKCVDQMTRPSKPLSERLLLLRYDKYIKKEERKQQKFEDRKVDERWGAVREEIFTRDGHRCRLKSILSIQELRLFKEHDGYFMNTLDGAHVIARSISKNLYYEPRNIITLDRVFHSRLDFNKCPLTGKGITRQEKEWWWIRIIGREEWEWLNNNK